MHFEHSERTKEWVGRVSRFMDEHIIPAVPTYEKQQKEGGRWKVIQVVEDLKVKALDTVQLDTSRYGLSNYAFQVLNWGLSADWGVVLSLREENEDIYDAPSPVSAPSVPAIVVPDPMGGPVDPAEVG